MEYGLFIGFIRRSSLHRLNCVCPSLYLASNMTKRWKITLGIIGGIAVVLIITWLSPFGRFVLTGGLGELDEQPFNQQQWIAARNAEPLVLRTRLMMVDDLMENRVKKGIDSLAVKEMLGEPERQYGFSYALGTLAEGMDPFFLIVDFDSTGHVNQLLIKSENKIKSDAEGMVKIELKN